MSVLLSRIVTARILREVPRSPECFPRAAESLRHAQVDPVELRLIALAVQIEARGKELVLRGDHLEVRREPARYFLLDQPVVLVGVVEPRLDGLELSEPRLQAQPAVVHLETDLVFQVVPDDLGLPQVRALAGHRGARAARRRRAGAGSRPPPSSRSSR
jgi:hypothetical protein